MARLEIAAPQVRVPLVVDLVQGMEGNI